MTDSKLMNDRKILANGWVSGTGLAVFSTGVGLAEPMLAEPEHCASRKFEMAHRNC